MDQFNMAKFLKYYKHNYGFIQVKYFPKSYTNCRKLRTFKKNKSKSTDIFIQNKFLKFYTHASCFLYLITNNEYISNVFRYWKARDYSCPYYIDDFDEFYILDCEKPISINVNSAVINMCDVVLKQLDTFKKDKITFLKKLYNQSIKNIEFAAEECETIIKLLSSISKIDKYDEFNDNLVTQLLLEPIQQHTFIMSTMIIPISFSSAFGIEPMMYFFSMYSEHLYPKMYFTPKI